MTTEQLSPQIQNQISQIQQIQQQMQSLSMQKSQTDLVVHEAELSLKEIDKLEIENCEIYKIIGELMIKSKRDIVFKDLKDKIETLKIRKQSMLRQEERMTTRFKQLQDQLKNMIGSKENE